MRNIIKIIVSLLLKCMLVFHKEKPTIRASFIKNILVVQTGGIGDILRIFPALETLFENFPEASISILAFPHATKAFQLFPRKQHISEIIRYDPEGIHKSFMKRIALILFLRKKKYDLVYVPARGKGTNGTLIMVYLTGSPHRIGFDGDGGAGFLNTVRLSFKRDIPITEQNILLLEAAGLKIKNKGIRLSIPEEDMNFAEHLTGKGSSSFLISVHPGAMWNTSYRCWPIENYLLLIKTLINELQARVVILGGKEENDERFTRSIHSSDLIDVIGKVTLPQLAAIIKVSDIFIGNDSGPLHIAEAAGTPYIGIFGHTIPRQVLSCPPGPLRIRLLGKLSCSNNCYTHHGAFNPACKDIRCRSLDTISVDEVLDTVNRLVTTIRKEGVSLADRN
ncbi:MAG: glycosyltransferase family 9 protein [wastewater metagenome]|nr:glycosyltransferase family 9 protein [Candidatus Loosdrechtia aerotolerans]